MRSVTTYRYCKKNFSQLENCCDSRTCTFIETPFSCMSKMTKTTTINATLQSIALAKHRVYASIDENLNDIGSHVDIKACIK